MPITLEPGGARPPTPTEQGYIRTAIGVETLVISAGPVPTAGNPLSITPGQWLRQATASPSIFKWYQWNGSLWVFVREDGVTFLSEIEMNNRWVAHGYSQPLEPSQIEQFWANVGGKPEGGGGGGGGIDLRYLLYGSSIDYGTPDSNPINNQNPAVAHSFRAAGFSGFSQCYMNCGYGELGEVVVALDLLPGLYWFEITSSPAYAGKVFIKDCPNLSTVLFGSQVSDCQFGLQPDNSSNGRITLAGNLQSLSLLSCPSSNLVDIDISQVTHISNAIYFQLYYNILGSTVLEELVIKLDALGVAGGTLATGGMGGPVRLSVAGAALTSLQGRGFIHDLNTVP
jgi:hypothetical protein